MTFKSDNCIVSRVDFPPSSAVFLLKPFPLHYLYCKKKKSSITIILPFFFSRVLPTISFVCNAFPKFMKGLYSSMKSSSFWYHNFAVSFLLSNKTIYLIFLSAFKRDGWVGVFSTFGGVLFVLFVTSKLVLTRGFTRESQSLKRNCPKARWVGQKD